MINKEMMRMPTEKEKEMIGSLKYYNDTTSKESLIEIFLAFLGIMLFPMTPIGRDILDSPLSVLWLTLIVVSVIALISTFANYINVRNTEVKEEDVENYNEWYLVDCVTEDVTIGEYRSLVVGCTKEKNSQKLSFETANNVVEKLFKHNEFVLFVKDNAICDIIGIGGNVEIVENIQFDDEEEKA